MSRRALSLAEDSAICVAGDWHGATGAAVARIEHAAERGADVIVHAGDFGVDRPRYADRFIGAVGRALASTDLELWLVPGNHDHWAVLRSLPFMEGGLQKLTNRISVVPRGHRWSWAGHTWMGLSGAVSVDRDRLTPGTSWWPQEAMTDADVEAAVAGGESVDIVVAHDAPAGVAVPGLDQPSPWPADALADAAAHRDRLQRVALRVKPRVWLHGHHHRRYTTQVALGHDPRRPEHSGVMTVHGLAHEQASVTQNMVFVHPSGELIQN